jgi:proteasome alpha subunit
LGHPADIEKIRQAAIDAAHLEAFNRAPEDVSLRRLVGFGLSPQLKTNFEQIFSAPYLVEFLLVEVGAEPAHDLLTRLHFDGAFQLHTKGVVVVASQHDAESAAQTWLNQVAPPPQDRGAMVEILMQAWWCLVENKPFDGDLPAEAERRDGWRKAVNGRNVEIGWLARKAPRRARYSELTLSDLGL